MQSILPASQTILPEYSNRIESEVLLQSRSLGNESEIRGSASSLNHGSSNLHLESTTPLNTEIKKRSSKSRSRPEGSLLRNKSVRISDSIPSNNIDSIEKISSKDLDTLYERESKRDEKNKANMTRLLTT